MSAFVSQSRHIRDALITLLETIQYDAGSGAEQAFALVDGNPTNDDLKEEPYALVYPDTLLTTKSQVGEQDRSVQFKVFVMLKLENGINADGSERTQDQTYDLMYNLSELVVNALDEADYHGTLHSEDNAITNWILDATRGSFVPYALKSGAVLVCTIDIVVKYSFQL